VNEKQNERQTFDREMIMASKRLEVEDEIRLRVDQLMREELDILKIVRDLSLLYRYIKYCYKIIFRFLFFVSAFFGIFIYCI